MTRWNSTYLVLERVINLKRPVQLYLAENEIVKITAHEFNIAEKMIEILKPFFDITKQMSSDVAGISTVIPAILALVRFLEMEADPGMVGNKNALLAAVKKRFLSKQLNILDNSLYVLPTILDSRYKHSFLMKKSKM